MLGNRFDFYDTYYNCAAHYFCSVEDRTSFQVLLAFSVDLVYALCSIVCCRVIGGNCLKLGSMLRDALRALFRKPVTVQYLTKAGEMVPLPERYRGEIVYDKEACIGCLLCIRLCPSGTITATEKKKVKFNISRCIFCGQCAEICPTEAIKLGSNFEMVVHEKEDLTVQ